MAISTTSLFLCRDVWEDAISKDVTASGIFTDIRVDRLPSGQMDFFVYALLRGQPEEGGTLRLVMKEPQSGDEIDLDSGNVIIGRNGLRHIRLRVAELSFDTL